MRLTRIQLDGCSNSWVVLMEDFMSSRNTTSAPPTNCMCIGKSIVYSAKLILFCI